MLLESLFKDSQGQLTERAQHFADSTELPGIRRTHLGITPHQARLPTHPPAADLSHVRVTCVRADFADIVFAGLVQPVVEAVVLRTLLLVALHLFPAALAEALGFQVVLQATYACIVRRLAVSSNTIPAGLLARDLVMHTPPDHADGHGSHGVMQHSAAYGHAAAGLC
jgi:hypothetical protein